MDSIEELPKRMKNEEKRIFITPKQAESVLFEGDNIHTFRNPIGMLIGCDRSRGSIIESLASAGPDSIEIGGPSCMNMGHGLILWDNGPLFIECDTEKLKKLESDLIMKSEELPKERTLAKCSCCTSPMWSDGQRMEVSEWRKLSWEHRSTAPLSVCSACTDEADDLGITVEQLRERNNEHSVETEAY